MHSTAVIASAGHLCHATRFVTNVFEYMTWRDEYNLTRLL